MKYAKEATEIFERLIGDSPELADSLNVLGNSLQRQFKLEESLEVHHRSLKIREKLYPPGHEKHPAVAGALHNIGIVYFYNNDLEQAESHYLRAIEIDRQYLPEDDMSLATAKHVLSIVYANQSKFEAARKWQQESFGVRKKIFPEDHDHVGLSNNWLGNIYRGLKMYSESEPLLRRAVEIHTGVYGAENGLVVWDQQSLLRTLIKLQKFDESADLLADLYSLMEKGDQFANKNTLGVLRSDIEYGRGEKEQCRATLNELIDNFDTNDAEMDRSTAIARLKLAVVDAELGEPFNRAEYDAAIAFLIENEKWPATDPQLLELQTHVANALF